MFIIRFQIVEGPDEKGCDDGREQGGLQIASVQLESTTTPKDGTHENEQHV